MQPLDLGFCFFHLLLNFTFCSTGVGTRRLVLIGLKLLTGSNTVPSDRVAGLAIPHPARPLSRRVGGSNVSLLDLKRRYTSARRCLADGRVFNFPFSSSGLTELDPRPARRAASRDPFQGGNTCRVDPNRITSLTVHGFQATGALAAVSYQSSASRQPCKSLSFTGSCRYIPQPERPFLGLSSNLTSAFSSKGRRQFFASIQNAFGFCQPVIPDITSTTAQLAQALPLLFGRFESEFVKLSEFAFSAQCVNIIAISIKPIGENAIH